MQSSLFKTLCFLCTSLVWNACTEPRSPEVSQTKIVDESLVTADLLQQGPFQHEELEYNSGLMFDEDVLKIGLNERPVRTDIRGRLFFPTGRGPFPLIVFLHGNHQTCGYPTGAGNPRLDQSTEVTWNRACPKGWVEAPSYRGYDASARQLASWGYAVISINANSGINGREGPKADPSLIAARGALVLRHLEEFQKWSDTGVTELAETSLELKDRIDFSRVGLMGHSRGGEGVRYAYNLYDKLSDEWKDRIPGLQIKGIFEIAPVDVGVNKTKVDAPATAWNVLIAGCDRDVYDFSGVNPFSRMIQSPDDGFAKSVFTLWGANHNFFNSEWQVSDAPHACIGTQKPLWNVKAKTLEAPIPDPLALEGVTGSEVQITFAKALLFAFFRTHLSGEQELGHIFDPQWRLPRQLTTLTTATSRESIKLSSSTTVFAASQVATVTLPSSLRVLTLDHFITESFAQLTASWKSYQDSTQSGRYRAVLRPQSSARPALIIEGGPDASPRELVLPFATAQKAANFWTMDIPLAVRSGCHSFDSLLNWLCPARSLAQGMEIALVLANGRTTQAVALQDYVSLDNWYDAFFDQRGMFQDKEGTFEVNYSMIPIIYQTARFELTDFGPLEADITGVKLIVPAAKDVSFLVESVRLTQQAQP